MAKVIKSDVESQTISTSYSLWQNALVGVLLGIIYWFLMTLIGYYIKSTNISGDIITIIVAILGTVVMLRLHMAQPLIIAVATGASLWGISGWTSGLVWWETVAWIVLLYGLDYVFFSWVARYARALPVLITMIFVIIVVRIASVL